MDHRAHTVKPANPPAAATVSAATASGWRDVRLARDPGGRRAGLAGLVPDRAPPNANNVGTPPERAVRRGWLLLKTFPEVVPGPRSRSRFWETASRS